MCKYVSHKIEMDIVIIILSYYYLLRKVKMVKNSIGGNKAKKQGRKHIISAADSNNTKKLRIATEEGELYAYISKMYGNGMCCALGINGKEYLCRIRNKFSGRSKRDNMIIVGSWVLVGLREWENNNIKKSCDLLEIYNSNEIEQLKNRVYENWSVFPSNDFGLATSNTIGEDELKFSEESIDIFIPPQKIPNTTDCGDCGDIYNINSDIVNFDDI